MHWGPEPLRSDGRPPAAQPFAPQLRQRRSSGGGRQDRRRQAGQPGEEPAELQPDRAHGPHIWQRPSIWGVGKVHCNDMLAEVRGRQRKRRSRLQPLPASVAFQIEVQAEHEPERQIG